MPVRLYAIIYLISVDDDIYINITIIMLLIEESGNIFKSFNIIQFHFISLTSFYSMPTWSDVD